MYPYSNKATLYDLNAEGDGNKLMFRTSTEEASVLISPENRIYEVVHKDLTNGKENRFLPSSAHSIIVGTNNWQRDVYHFLRQTPHIHSQLRLGLTVHRGAGTWSSLPHSFENHPEPGFEEIFFYLLSGGTRRAIQVGRGIWADGTKVDATWFVEDRVFSVIPMGYHPVVGEPGVKVSYIWAYLAKKKEWEKI